MPDAVITGDIVSSSKFPVNMWDKLQMFMRESWKISSDWAGVCVSPISIYRGDSFQGLLWKSENALEFALILRINFLHQFGQHLKYERPDLRLSIGIGDIDQYADKAISERNGPAFRLSGHGLDSLKKEKRRIAIQTPRQEINDELMIECILLDAIIERWTLDQIHKIYLYYKLKKQKAVAGELGISQAGVSQQMRRAGFPAIKKFCERFEYLIRTNL